MHALSCWSRPACVAGCASLARPAQDCHALQSALGAPSACCGPRRRAFRPPQIHPIDLTKVRLQLVGESLAAGATRPSAVAVVSKIVAEEGFAGLYSG